MKPYRFSNRGKRDATRSRRGESPRRGISNFMLALVAYAGFTTGALVDSHLKPPPPVPIVQAHDSAKTRFSDAEAPGEIAVTRRQSPVDAATFGTSCEAMIRSMFDGERPAAIRMLDQESQPLRASALYRVEHLLAAHPSPITVRCVLDKKTWRISVTIVDAPEGAASPRR